MFKEALLGGGGVIYNCTGELQMFPKHLLKRTVFLKICKQPKNESECFIFLTNVFVPGVVRV